MCTQTISTLPPHFFTSYILQVLRLVLVPFELTVLEYLNYYYSRRQLWHVVHDEHICIKCVIVTNISPSSSPHLLPMLLLFPLSPSPPPSTSFTITSFHLFHHYLLLPPLLPSPPPTTSLPSPSPP